MVHCTIIFFNFVHFNPNLAFEKTIKTKVKNLNSKMENYRKMNNYIHSDLACELSKNFDSFIRNNDSNKAENGFYFNKREDKSILISSMKIDADEAKVDPSLRAGNYITLSFSDCTKMNEEECADLSKTIAVEINKLIPQNTSKILLCGLGNRNMTTDSIGPKAIEKTTVTRHVKEVYKDVFSNAKSICAIMPGVLAQTGIESADIIASVSKKILPDAIITIDSICTKSRSRLCTTMQITDTGVSPGSGVNNKRPTINAELTDVPVISIGFPTVINSSTLIYELLSP